MNSEYILNNLEDLDLFTQDLVKEISYPLTIGLIGDLGAGKTTLTTYLLSKLGVEESISSPTYVLENQYKIDDIQIEHWDLYRLTTLPFEIMEEPVGKVLRIIEWVNKIPNHEKYIDLEINITIEDDDVRSVVCKSFSK